MALFNCPQRGCSFEADSLPDVCPVCNNPIPFESQVEQSLESTGNVELSEENKEAAASISVAFQQGYNEGVIYLNDETPGNPPDDYDDIQAGAWHEGYAAAIEDDAQNDEE